MAVVGRERVPSSARSASTYMCVVAGLSWPSQRAMMVMSIPDWSRCMAVVWWIVCGEMARSSNAGIVFPVALTYTARRLVTFERVIAFPSQVGNSAAASGTAPT
ncbi:MAG: hypothetical protein VR70_18485 [Rhodospirillaceae bacterium BRH_c57]|nr:MAG: hypothetical protein VR70_18485 [Rhodospirillaceae bacterium BRH_c57]